MINFLLIVSTEGHIKFSHYFIFMPYEKRPAVEAKAVDLCMNHDKNTSHFIEDGDQMIIFHWFGPCLLIASTSLQENELLVYEFLNLFVTTLHRYFGKFSEKHILFNGEKLHMVLEEIVVNGEIVESNMNNILTPLFLLDNLNKT